MTHATQADILSYDLNDFLHSVSGEEGTSQDCLESLNAFLPRSQRILAGEELVKIKLKVDVYHFNMEGGHGEI